MNVPVDQRPKATAKLVVAPLTTFGVHFGNALIVGISRQRINVTYCQ